MSYAAAILGHNPCKASDLELLESGNFADVEIICGDSSWKCHRAILASRSVWFRKALSGPFQESSTRQVRLEEKNPNCVYLALKYIYGAGLDVASSVSDEHFIEHCVGLWQTADYLLLPPLQQSVEDAVGDYCDERLKDMCTTPAKKTLKQDGDQDYQLSPGALDLVSGIRDAYKWRIEKLKRVLLEFIWAGRPWILRGGMASTILDHLKETPDFASDLLGHYASGPWLSDPTWAPKVDSKAGGERDAERRCTNCGWRLVNGQESVVDPFKLDSNNDFSREWCESCVGFGIPWRSSLLFRGSASVDPEI